MKNILLLIIAVPAFLTGCSSLPSYHEMSCSELLKKETSLQKDFKLDRVGAILAGVNDIVVDDAKSTADSNQSEIELNATKRELREVQGVIHQRRCKK